MITFYDIDSPIKGRSFSPSTIKTRYSLAFKDLDFETIYVPYSEVESTCKQLGAKPTGVLPDGAPRYTLPVIHDSPTRSLVSDSFEIAVYLDKAYPDKPMLFPSGSVGLQYHFGQYMGTVLSDLKNLALPQTAVRFEQEGDLQQAKAVRARWEPIVGSKLEALNPTSREDAEERWNNIKKGFNELELIILKNGEGSKYAFGKAVTYVDFMVVADLFFIQAVFGKESAVWKRLESLNRGRWTDLSEEVNSRYGKL